MPQSTPQSIPGPGLHRFAVILALCVVGLISAGALVTSKEAGLAVPDWPLSYGSLNPPRWWEIENVRAEHGHRLIAGTVAALTVLLAVWTGRVERRRWVRRLAYLAVGAVLLQALLGGLTVLLLLPTPVSVSHAALAEVFLCLVVSLALVTSRWWRDRERAAAADPAYLPAARAAAATTVLIFAQILAGAVMRHSGAGLAIPDFPLAFGRLVPPRLDFAIGVHFTHRLGALLVAAAVFWTLARVLRGPARSWRLTVPAVAMSILVLGQIALGATVVLSGKAVLPNTAHVATGASLLALALTLALTAGRMAAGLRRAAAAAPAGEGVALPGAAA